MTKRDNSGNDRKTVLCVNIFQEDINMAKKNPIAAAAKKMAAAPVSNSVVTEVKAAEVKAETKTEAPKAEEPKKETKKAPAKRAAAKDIKTFLLTGIGGSIKIFSKSRKII